MEKYNEKTGDELLGVTDNDGYIIDEDGEKVLNFDMKVVRVKNSFGPMEDFFKKMADDRINKYHLLTREQMKAAREKLGLTRKQAADITGFQEWQIEAWETDSLQDPAYERWLREKAGL
jgi:DNA-binding XRE family transcriptional regulator